MRLIDADVFKYALGCSDEAMRFDAMIDEMPTINLSPVWTPCSKGMPEDAPDFSPMSRYECTIMIPDGTREVFTLHRTGNSTWLYETGKGLGVVRGDQVLAWQPLPEPYNHDHIVDPNKMVIEQP